MVFLLNIFDNGFALGKCFFHILKMFFPMLVLTFKERGGLNHMIFLLLFRVCFSPSFFLYFNFSLKPLLCSACSHVVFAASKMSWLHEVSVIRLLIGLCSSFKIFGGWFECLLM